MSAFICGNHHINAIIKWASKNKVSFCGTSAVLDVRGNEQACVEYMQAANAKSVNERYGDDEPEAGYTYTTKGVPDLTAIGVIKACHCLNYQSCEYDGWKQSDSYHLLQAVIESATSELPGYDKAVWEVRP